MNAARPAGYHQWSKDEQDKFYAEIAAAEGYDRGERPVRPQIKASPFVWIEPAAIPRRRWIYGRHYVRKFISETVAPGAYGKSTLEMAEALAICTGRTLLGITPDERVNVWYWNGEDSMEELQRRIIAAAVHYEIDPTEIEGRLFVDTGREAKIIIAEQGKAGALIARPLVDAVIATIQTNDIGLMIIDPFVASHRVVENDNPAIELVAATWAEIADITGCAIELVHHARKTGGAEITVEDGRGGSALLAKVRSARTLNGMTEDEAARAGVDNRRAYFRVQNGKANLSPPADASEWYRLESFDLGNAGDGHPSDSVGVVTRWKWPDAFEGVTASDLRAVQDAIAADRWRENSQAKDWAGYAVATVLKLDATNKAHRAKVAALLKTWIENGMFVVVEGLDAERKKRSFVEVGTSAND
ncbi:AAA family ATPase [Roseiarcus sp.]|uniref:AAA family ATPase n=1 Tax=Roseiarcus sp. TaxID=1969460 RepID=UPI003F99D939